MHILATFATLCCQTRWPRNHSCTTQEHVSFFRTFSGHFRKFRLFRHFDEFWQNLQILHKTRKTQIHKCADKCKREFTNAHMFEKCFHLCKTSAHNAKTQMHKSANVQKPSVHKMRKSAAHTFLQMQLSANSQICTVHKNTNANFTNVQIVFTRDKIFSTQFIFIKIIYWRKKIFCS